jgi:hypothetical protein
MRPPGQETTRVSIDRSRDTTVLFYDGSIFAESGDACRRDARR